MKIGIYWLAKNYGGVETHLKNLINQWPSAFDRFFIFTNKSNEGFKRIKNDIKISKLIYVKSDWDYLNSKILGILNIFFLPIIFLFFYFRTLEEIKRYQLDHLVLNCGGYPGSWKTLACVIAARSLNIKGVYLLVHHSVQKKIFKFPFEFFLDKLIIKNCKKIICVSNATKKSLTETRKLKIFNRKFITIYNGIDVKYKVKKIDKKLKFPKAKKIIALVGRIEKYKGHEDLLHALSYLKKEFRNRFFVVIIGREGSVGEIERLKRITKQLSLQKIVRFQGYFNNNILDLLNSVDISMVLTRDFEGFGYVAAESMLLGKVVFSTNVGGLRELVNKKISILVKPNNPNNLSKKLKFYLDNQNKINRKATQGKKYIIKKFNAKKMSKSFFNVMNNS